jgi:serine/threonine protein kinase
MEHGGHETYVYYARKLRSVRSEDAGWIKTDEAVAIKVVSFECIRDNQGIISEDFIKEVAANEYLSNELRGETIEETHVLTADVIMCDNENLYIVMPYCDGGDLCSLVFHRLIFERRPLTEVEVRSHFEQILRVSFAERRARHVTSC